MSAVERRVELSVVTGGWSRAAAESSVAFGPLNEIAGFMLRLAQLQVFDAFFTEFGNSDIRPGQIGILVAIRENDGIRQGTLAKALRVKRSNMAKMIRLLVSEDLIRRRVPANDRRAVELSLTPHGRAVLDRALPDIHANDRIATAALSGSERRALMRLLRKLTDAHLSEARA